MSSTEWATDTIAALGRGAGPTVQTGPFGSQLHADDYVEDGVPFILIRNIGDGGLQPDNLPRVSEADANRLARYSLKEGDIVFSRVGRIGSCLLITVNEEGWIISGQTLRLRLQNPDIDERFLLNYLRSHAVQNFVSLASVGTTRESLNTKILRSIPVRRPVAKKEQRRIAEILGTVDEVIEQTEALIVKHQQVKAGLMHDLFTRGLTPDGRLRPAGTERKTKFGWLPKDWRIGSLADATSSARQPILTGPFGADLGNDDFVDEGVPLLRIGNVQTGRIDVNDLLYVTPTKAAQLERYRIRSGDLLFARQGATTGRNALASDEVDGWLINYHIIRVALDHSLCAPVFIEAAFNEEMVLRQVEKDKGRGTREGINSEQLRSLELPLPPDRDEQVRIADRLVAQQRAIATETAHLAKLRQLKQGLMQALLTPPSQRG